MRVGVGAVAVHLELCFINYIYLPLMQIFVFALYKYLFSQFNIKMVCMHAKVTHLARPTHLPPQRDRHHA